MYLIYLYSVHTKLIIFYFHLLPVVRTAYYVSEAISTFFYMMQNSFLDLKYILLIFVQDKREIFHQLKTVGKCLRKSQCWKFV